MIDASCIANSASPIVMDDDLFRIGADLFRNDASFAGIDNDLFILDASRIANSASPIVMDGDLFRNDASPVGIDDDLFRIGANLLVIVDKEALCLGYFVGASV